MKQTFLKVILSGDKDNWSSIVPPKRGKRIVN